MIILLTAILALYLLFGAWYSDKLCQSVIEMKNLTQTKTEQELNRQLRRLLVELRQEIGGFKLDLLIFATRIVIMLGWPAILTLKPNSI